jgi:hypothetical protein
MKATRTLIAALLAFACAGTAWADRPHHWHHPRTTVEFGFVFGPPFHPYPYPYPHPVFWPPVVVPQPIVVQPAPIYIEQSPPAVQTLEPGYWYWCAEAKAYYPDVKSCPGPWQKIAPRPAQ